MIHTRIHFPNYQVTASLYHTLLTNEALFCTRRIHHGNKPTFITRNKPTPTSQSDKFNLPAWLLALWRLSCCSLPYSIHSIIIASRPAGCNSGILPFGSSFSYLRNICSTNASTTVLHGYRFFASCWPLMRAMLG